MATKLHRLVERKKKKKKAFAGTAVCTSSREEYYFIYSLGWKSNKLINGVNREPIAKNGSESIVTLKNGPDRSLPCNHTGNCARTRPPRHGGGGRRRFTSREEGSLVSQTQVVGMGGVVLAVNAGQIRCSPTWKRRWPVIHVASILLAVSCPKRLALPPLQSIRTSPLFHHTHDFFLLLLPTILQHDEDCFFSFSHFSFFFSSSIPSQHSCAWKMDGKTTE